MFNITTRTTIVDTNRIIQDGQNNPIRKIEKKWPRINSKVEKDYSKVDYRTGKKWPPKTMRLKQRKSSHENS